MIQNRYFFPAGAAFAGAVLSCAAGFVPSSFLAGSAAFAGASFGPAASATVASDSANVTAMITDNSFFIFPYLLVLVESRLLYKIFKDDAKPLTRKCLRKSAT
jgi:hypothetical protein